MIEDLIKQCKVRRGVTGLELPEIARMIIGKNGMTANVAEFALSDLRCVSIAVAEDSIYFVTSTGYVYEQRWLNGDCEWTRVFPPTGGRQ